MKLFLKGLLALTAMLVVGCESNDSSTSPHASGTPLALSETGIVAEYVLVDTHIDFNNGVSVDKNDFAISGTCTIDNDSSLTQKFIINGNTTSAYGTIVELGLIGTSTYSSLINDGSGRQNLVEMELRGDTLITRMTLSKAMDPNKIGFYEEDYWLKVADITSAESAAKVRADSANRPIHGMVGNGIGVAQFLRD